MSTNIFETLKSHPLNLIAMIVATVIAGAFSLYQEYEKYEHNRIREENLTVTKQVESLEQFKKSLGELIIFVDKQKSNLEEREIIIQNLESEKTRLEPLVNADKKVVEALFTAQIEMQRTSVWIDRIIGFFLGVAGSLVASLIWKSFHEKNKQA